MAEKYERYKRLIPKILKPGTNPVISALLEGFADEDEQISLQLDATKAQLFIKTAEGIYLTKRASSLGVERPTELGMEDADYRKLVPNLSLKHKQIRKTFYDTMDVFWGTRYSRANVLSNNCAPFNLSVGDEFKVSINNQPTQTIKIVTGDIVTAGAATAIEVNNILSRISGGYSETSEDPITGNEYIRILTDAVGLRGSVEIITCTGFTATKLDFILGKYELWQQPQRTIIYEVNPNELTIEIPAIIPVLRRTLKGSHHFHTDETIEAPVAPANGVWQGSFMYDPSGVYGNFVVSSKRAILQQNLTKGNIYTAITVDDTSDFDVSTGDLIFGFGMNSQELPVKFRGIPNSNTILIDPSYKFTKNQGIGTYVNILTSKNAKVPSKDGSDYAVFLTSPSAARAIVQTILESLAAAGVIINFVILLPKYKYMIRNPYL